MSEYLLVVSENVIHIMGSIIIIIIIIAKATRNLNHFY